MPVIAAGAISTGRQIAASLALGAELVYMGTRFIPSSECGAPADYKKMVVDAGPEDIVYTDKVSGVHANFLRDSMPEDWKPGEELLGAKRWVDTWSAGQGVTEIHDQQSIEQIVESLVREYHDAVAALPR